MGAIRGTLLVNEPMSRHTSWRIGGPAERFFRPADLEDLELFLKQLTPDEPVYWLGLGSNLLVRDGGIRGTVISTFGCLEAIDRLDRQRVRVEAGVPCPLVARFCTREGLAGAEFLSGIPGAFGGALAMNAGCFGAETWDLVEKVETLDRYGELHERDPGEYRIAYREVDGPEGEWFVAATLRLTKGESKVLALQVRELLDKRGASQPTQLPNAGSVFRNPVGDHAARLIEAAGLKGHCIGKACISDKHANFIVNNGGARAADVEALIELIVNEVHTQFDITLQREVHIIGEVTE